MTDAHDREIATMFDRIATRYDFLNRVLSFGTDIGWRRRTIARADIRPGALILDVGAGTGDLSFAAAARGAHVVALDLSPGMLEVLARRSTGPPQARPPAAGAPDPRRERRVSPAPRRERGPHRHRVHRPQHRRSPPGVRR